jgi:D-glycero-alpha-D-manno-heptose-7-phosphate kinase
VSLTRRAHAAAPVRLDFAGGWTDVPPYSDREGGAVVTASISLRVHVNVLPGGDSVHLLSEDLGTQVELLPDGRRAGAGSLPLLEAGVRAMSVGPATIVTRSDVPQGSGLGSSGALGVAIVASLAHARGETPSALEIAERAWRLEALEAGHPGGRQDQYAAALGGFQSMAFGPDGVTAQPIALDVAFMEELGRSVALCYTGTSRVSGETIARVMSACERGERAITGALAGLRETAMAMHQALVAADLTRVATLLDVNWRHQQALDPGMRTAGMIELEAAARRAGAIGGKAAGAGAGGSMFFIAPGRADAVAEAARAIGAQPLAFSWSAEGVRRW